MTSQNHRQPMGSASGRPPVKRKIDPIKRKHMMINRNLILVLLIACIGVIIAMGINIARIAMATEGSGKSESLSSDTAKSMKNEQYEIGNNPTDIQKKYFQNLTDAIAAQDDPTICEAVVESFVSDYFTWTNKDGNYEVGGLQYIYGEQYTAFETWSRYNYYSDMDLYISQYGRTKLIQVDSVTVTEPTSVAPDFTVTSFDADENIQENTYSSYEVNVSWTYKNNGANTSAFPSAGRFYLVNNNGRWEIVEFYDAVSISEWEAENSSEATAATE